MDKDLITIVVTTSNSSREYLHGSLGLALKQTYSNLEIVVIDDHSTDPLTIELLHSYAARDPRIKVVFNAEHQGVSYGRNLGVKLGSR